MSSLVDHEGVEACRGYGRHPDGSLVCHNDIFYIHKNSPHKGQGYQFTARQVAALCALGFHKIMMGSAVGRKGANSNGYYTWPLFGFGGRMHDYQYSELAPEFQKALGKSREILDLFELPGGPEEWKEKGSGLSNLEFDLSDGSRSMRRLEAYIRERESRPAQGAAP